MENPPVVESPSSTTSTTTQTMSPEERFKIVRSIGEECIQEEELLKLLTKKPHPICYDGFEPSGRMHIAQGVLKKINVNKLTSAGCVVKIWIADWFAQLNNKMGGDLAKIQVLGQYFIEIWKALGMDTEGGKVEFKWSSKEILSRSDEYLRLVFGIARRNNLPRIRRCCQIMGRKEQDDLTGAQIFYPCMQCADVFFLKADICQLGMDQRKVNMLAREYCDDIKRKNKPIILSHHMLPGLLEGQEKMSKSNASSAIFMEDEEVDVISKIENAYCPPRIVEGNPCLEYLKYIVFPSFDDKLTVERKEENKGKKLYTSFEELVADYEKGDIHPADLKLALSTAINKILQPVRDHFKNNEEAKALLKRVKGFMENPLVKEVESLSLKSEEDDSSSNSSCTTTIQMSAETRFEIVRSVGEECIQEDELLRLLTNKPHPICYDGFEPSGRMHIAQGVMKMINVKKLTSAGCKVKILIADYFAQLNNKMGGDLAKIQVVGQYLIEIFKAVGMDTEGGKVEFLWSSKEVNSRPDEYLPLVFDNATRNNLPRIMRCCEIMGRNEDELTAGQIFYLCMQCADIFFLKADICQLGMDQREVNMLAREYCDVTKRENKPIILSHHMLPGLLQGQAKMSSTDLSSAIFMDDEEAEVNLKIKKAYCPPSIVDGNPCLEYVKYLVFPWLKLNDERFEVVRKEENGGNKPYVRFEEVVADYEKGDLHPADLKIALSKALNKILQPVRDHFKSNEKAKALLKRVKGFKVTK